MSDFVVAPWDADQVDNLNRYQRLGHVHEFTCGNDHAGNKALFATRHGWCCPHCDYQQNWAHRAMFAAVEDQIKLSCDVIIPPNTIIRKGCALSILMDAMSQRGHWSAEDCRFNEPGKAIAEAFVRISE